MLEIAIILKKPLFTKLLSSNGNHIRGICRRSSRLLLSGGSVLIYYQNTDWSSLSHEEHSYLFDMIRILDSEDSNNFYYLEWIPESNHGDKMGSYEDNPWEVRLENGIKYKECGKNFNLSSLF